MLVYADDEALHQGIGPVAVDNVGLRLCAEREEVVLTGEKNARKKRKRFIENHHFVF